MRFAFERSASASASGAPLRGPTILAFMFALAIAFLFPGGALASEDAYRLGPGDEVRVTVFREPDMSGTFAIDASGTISVPGVGEIHGQGLTTRELKDAVVAAMTARDLVNPDVSVQVTQYGPVFVMGDVRSPGRFAYAPGMTVLQLVAIAGGFALPPEIADGPISARDQGFWRQEMDVARERLAALIVKRARLQAQREERLEIVPPPGLQEQLGKDRVDRMLAVEAELLRLKIEEPRRRVEMMRKQQGDIDQEVSALQDQVASNRQLKRIIDEELSNVRSLRDRGILASPRVLELERLAVDTELKINSSLATLSQARQDRTALDLEIHRAQEELRTRTVEDFIESVNEIAVLNRRIAALAATLTLSDMPLTGAGALPSFARKFSIARTGEDAPVRATATTAIRPGDVLTVEKQVEEPIMAPSPQATDDASHQLGALRTEE